MSKGRQLNKRSMSDILLQIVYVILGLTMRPPKISCNRPPSTV